MTDTIGDRIRLRLDALGLSIRGAGSLADLPESTMRNILEGKSDNPRGSTLSKLAKALQTSEQWLLTGSDLPAPAEPAGTRRSELRPADVGQIRLDMPRDVPVLGTAAGSALGHGAFQLTTDVVDYVRRPAGLISAPGVYALYVEGDSMSPRFEPGDLVFVHPNRKPLGGDYVIIQEPDTDNGEPRAFIKRLVRITPTLIRTQQFNPEAALDFVIRPGLVVHKVMTDGDLYGV